MGVPGNGKIVNKIGHIVEFQENMVRIYESSASGICPVCFNRHALNQHGLMKHGSLMKQYGPCPGWYKSPVPLSILPIEKNLTWVWKDVYA